MSRRHARPAAQRIAAGLLLALLAAGCTTHQRAVPAATTMPRPIVQAGQLPPPPPRHDGPHLALPRPPKGLLRLPGSFPLGTQVRFQIPIRNDGDQPVRIDRLEAG